MCRSFGCERDFDAADASEGNMRWCDREGDRLGHDEHLV
jgi:hypothetical protein